MKIQFLTTLIAALIARNDELPEKKQRKCETVEYRKNCFKKKNMKIGINVNARIIVLIRER